MKLSGVIEALVAAGGTPEQIMAVVRAAEAEEEARDRAVTEAEEARRAAKRQGNADRQRRHRNAVSRVTARDERVTERDPSPPPALPPEPPNPPTPTPVVIPPLPPEAAPKGAPRRSLALPENWRPKPEHLALAASLGLAERCVLEQAEAMRDWAASNRHRPVGRSQDWDRKFNGWLRREPPAKAGKGPPMLLPIKGGATLDEPRIDLGNGQIVPEKVVLDVLRRREWIDTWGPRPGHPACRLPKHIVQGMAEAVA